MSQKTSRKLFVNITVRDLEKSMIDGHHLDGLQCGSQDIDALTGAYEGGSQS